MVFRSANYREQRSNVDEHMMNDTQQTMFFTDKAASKVRVMVAEQAESDDLLLRVYIEGSGCSGFQYGFEFDSAIEEDDTVVENVT